MKYKSAEEYLRDWPNGISGGKGGNSQQEMQNANQQQQMQNQLAQQQLQMQQTQLAGLNAGLDPIIANGGMSPAQQSALTSLALNNIPQTFNNAAGQINQNLVARGIVGGGNAGGGDAARQFAGLAAQEGALQQQSLSQIQLQKQQQLMQALGLKIGVAGQFGSNVGTFNQGASSALGSGVAAANNADQAQSGVLGSILGAATGLGSAAIGRH